MTVTRKELIKCRIQLTKEMNQYILNLEDEEIWFNWIAVGVPDEPSEADYEFIAENDDEWVDLCELFGRLTHVPNEWNKIEVE